MVSPTTTAAVRKKALTELKALLQAWLQGNLHAKMAIPDSQQYPWNLYLIYDVEDIIVFLVKKVWNSDNSWLFFSIDICRQFTIENNQY